MKAAIGIYEGHEEAVDAVKRLKESGFPLDKVSILGKAEEETIDTQLNTTTKNPVNMAGVGTGTAVGAALGILTGLGLFAIPGLGFLYGAGALVGAIGGIDFGLIGGGIASVIATVGIKDDNAKKYHTALENGKFLVVVHGGENDVTMAKDILHHHGRHEDVALH